MTDIKTEVETVAKGFWLTHRLTIILSVASLIAGFLLGKL